MFIDSRDSSHNAAFFSTFLYLCGLKDLSVSYFIPVRDILFKHPIFWIKNPTYKWSNCEDWRKKAFNLFGKDFYCGSNADQIEPLIQFCIISDQRDFLKKLLIGIILKLGFCDNLTNLFFRPRIASSFCRYYNFKLGYWLLDILEHIGKVELLPQSTKTIRLYLWLLMVNITGTETIWSRLMLWRYRKQDFRQYFDVYFCQPNNRMIYDKFLEIYPKFAYNLLYGIQTKNT